MLEGRKTTFPGRPGGRGARVLGQGDPGSSEDTKW